MHVLCVNKLFPLAKVPIVSLICTPPDTKLERAEAKINPHPLYYSAVLSHFKSGLTLCNPMDCSPPGCTLHSEHLFLPTSLLCPWNFPGKNTGVGCWPPVVASSKCPRTESVGGRMGE